MKGTPLPGVGYLRPPLKAYGFFNMRPAEGEQLASDAEAYIRDTMPVLLKNTPFAV